MPATHAILARTPVAAAVASLGIAFAASAQARDDSPAEPRTGTREQRPLDPRTDPALNDPTLEDVLTEQQRRRVNDEPVDPRPVLAPQQPLPTQPMPRGQGASARFYPEGSFVSMLQGRLLQTTTGQSVFDSGESGGFILLPCRRLDQLLTATSTLTGQVTVTLSGQVFAYRDRHYMLLTAYSVRAGEAQAPAPSTAPATAPAAGKPSTTDTKAQEPPAQPSSDALDIIRELESSRPAARAIDPAPSAAAPITPQTEIRSEPDDALEQRTTHALLAEGKVLTGRRGRIIRNPRDEGRLTFVLDNHAPADGPASFPLLPCRVLQSIETTAGYRGEEQTYIVSGRVTASGGKNYLLPTLVQTTRRGDMRPMQ